MQKKIPLIVTARMSKTDVAVSAVVPQKPSIFLGPDNSDTPRITGVKNWKIFSGFPVDN